MPSFLKDPRLENPHLLRMARCETRPCLLRVPDVCRAGASSVPCCACHGNSHEFGKGRGYKAHDFFSVWGCARCHRWLDESYSATGEERYMAFRTALVRQITAWAEIARAPTANPRDVDATRWALDHLVARGYAVRDVHLYASPIPAHLDALQQKAA